MFIPDLLNNFFTPQMIEDMGNWYPRVLAVMACVVPTIVLCFGGWCFAYIVKSLWLSFFGGRTR